VRNCAQGGDDGRKFVGWVERSDTHHQQDRNGAMGFANAQPILQAAFEQHALGMIGESKEDGF
jgi:hypothetical protein